MFDNSRYGNAYEIEGRFKRQTNCKTLYYLKRRKEDVPINMFQQKRDYFRSNTTSRVEKLD